MLMIFSIHRLSVPKFLDWWSKWTYKIFDCQSTATAQSTRRTKALLYSYYKSFVVLWKFCFACYFNLAVASDGQLLGVDCIQWNLRSILCQVIIQLTLSNQLYLMGELCKFSEYLYDFRERFSTHGMHSTHLSHNTQNLRSISDNSVSVLNVTSAGQCTGVEAAILDPRKLSPSHSSASSKHHRHYLSTICLLSVVFGVILKTNGWRWYSGRYYALRVNS